MIALYIIGGLLVLIGLLLLSGVCIRVRADGDFRVELRWLLLRFRLYPAKEKPKEKAEKKAAPKKESAVKVYLSDLFRKEGTVGGLKTLWDIAKAAMKPVLPFLGRATVDLKTFLLSVSSDDAAKTALEYGTANGLVYDTLAFLREKLKFRRCRVAVRSDFTATETTLALDLRIRWRVWHFLPLLVGLVRVYLNKISKPVAVNPNKGDSEHGGKQ